MKKLILIPVLLSVFQFASTQIINLDIKVFMEGPFNGIEMNADLFSKGIIPLSQPYNIEPWNYEGTESVPAIPNGNVIDWIFIEIRETTGDASTATAESVVERKVAFLLNNGQIVDLDGINLPELDNAITHNLFIVIRHRNHLAIMSSIPLVETKGTYAYNFTDDLNKAYLDGQKELGTSVFGMTAGDCDGSGIIDLDDKDNNWKIVSGETGYAASDVNLDGEINNIDKDDYWYFNYGNESKVPLEMAFNCGVQISDNDGNTYNTVQIGSQCWMKENLATTTYSNGTPIPNITDNSAWSNLTSGAYVWYENDISWKDKYAALYNWHAAVDANGLCPSGWSVPSNDDWTVLTDFIGGAGSTNGNKLKSCRQVNSPQPGGCNTTVHPRWNEYTTHFGTNNYGFTGFPGGFRFNNGNYSSVGETGFWWSSTQSSSSYAWLRSLGHYYGSVDLIDYYKKGGFSIRCIKD